MDELYRKVKIGRYDPIPRRYSTTASSVTFAGGISGAGLLSAASPLFDFSSSAGGEVGGAAGFLSSACLAESSRLDDGFSCFGAFFSVSDVSSSSSYSRLEFEFLVHEVFHSRSFAFWSLGASFSIDNFEWPVFHFVLHTSLCKLPTNKPLGFKYCVFRIPWCLNFCSFSNKGPRVSERHKGWSEATSMVIGNDVNSTIHGNTNTRVCSSKINSNCTVLTTF